MRVYGRIYAEDGSYTWQEVQTDPQGFNDFVYATALVQVLKLQLGESPFYATYGIPAVQSVLSQIAPDIYVARTQQQYAPFFGQLIITRVANAPTTLKQAPVPTYSVKVLTHYGAPLPSNIPV